MKENAEIPPSIRYFKLNTATNKHKKYIGLQADAFHKSNFPHIPIVFVYPPSK